MDDESLKLGLLLETAQTHQKLVEALIEKFKAQTDSLGSVVRDQLRRSFLEELAAVRTESQRAVEALQTVKRAANLRMILSTIGLVTIATAVAIFVAWWILPSSAELATLRAQRDELQSEIALLNQRGAKADIRRCGDKHLCVRVDPSAGRFGDGRDYYVIHGY